MCDVHYLTYTKYTLYVKYSSISSFLGFFSSKVPLKNRSNIFSLGSRGQVLTDLLEEPIIVPHAAQKTDKRVCCLFLSAFNPLSAGAFF